MGAEGAVGNLDKGETGRGEAMGAEGGQWATSDRGEARSGAVETNGQPLTLKKRGQGAEG